MNNNLFVYGSLMFPEVWQCFSDTENTTSIKAHLEDYTLFKVQGKSYPAIRFEAGSIVRGILYINISKTLLNELDEFEGKYYNRIKAAVLDSENDQHNCWTYILHKDFHYLETNQNWCKTKFQKLHLKEFLQKEFTL